MPDTARPRSGNINACDLKKLSNEEMSEILRRANFLETLLLEDYEDLDLDPTEFETSSRPK